ncbi:MAG: HigA family addiction module antitoxin [Pseudomonadota bacterium]
MSARRLNSSHPGEVLVDQFLLPHQESMAQLARALDEPIDRIQELISGQGRITEAMAMKLAHHYDVAANFWLGLQVAFDHQGAAC